MKQKILIVEDDEAILTGLGDLLESEGFKIKKAINGNEGLTFYKEENPDLIILDVMMPEKSGYEVCREIRKDDSTTPILMLTAKGLEVEKVVGLELGADDYLVKPFGIHELTARVRALLRRTKTKPSVKNSEPISFGNVYIDTPALKGKRNNVEFDVTMREIDILKLFMENEGKVLDRNTLLDKIWGVKYEGTTRTLDQHIAKLRQKVEDNPAEPKHILTVHTVGYKFSK